MASVCATTATEEQGTNAGPPISDPSIAADCHSNKTGDDKTDIDARTKRLKQKRNAMKNSRRARKAKAKEMQLMEKRAEVEKQIAAMISTVQADIQVVVEAEKRKSEQYLSLARKYYTMWKALNDERSASMNKQQMRERRKHSTYGVSALKEQNFAFPLAMTSVTMNKRFSDNASSSGPFKILGETLNISSSSSSGIGGGSSGSIGSNGGGGDSIM